MAEKGKILEFTRPEPELATAATFAGQEAPIRSWRMGLGFLLELTAWYGERVLRLRLIDTGGVVPVSGDNREKAYNRVFLVTPDEARSLAQMLEATARCSELQDETA